MMPGESSMEMDGCHVADNYTSADQQRRIRKAPSTGSEIFLVIPEAKRQMVSTSPSSVAMEVSPYPAPPIPSADDVLVHMIRQSGAKTSAEIVDFCLATGIPLSRCFKLDLMRQLRQNER